MKNYLLGACVCLLIMGVGCVEPPTSSSPSGNALVGEVCTSSVDCSGVLRCLSSGVQGGGGTCVQSCLTNAECATGLCTMLAGSNMGYCEPTTTPNDPDNPPIDNPIDDPIDDPNEDPIDDPNEDPQDDPNEDPQEDPLPPRPDLGMGPADSAANKSCTMLSASPDQILAVTNQGDAGQVIILPTDSKPYMVTLPEGEGYLTIEIPEWRSELAFFAHYTTDFLVIDGVPLGRMQWNGVCGDSEGITDTRLRFHSWGAFTIRYGAEGPREAWFSAIHLNP